MGPFHIRFFSVKVFQKYLSNLTKYHTMGFGDLKSDAGIKSLNDFLVDRSYIEGYMPSGSDDEVDEEAEKIKAERLAAYAAKKAKKPALIAKSSILLDVKPWDDETDMKELEKQVRTIECDGLVWGAAKLVPLAYGIKKLQIMCVVEDDKVGTDFLEEKISEFEDYVQSIDIAAFNKI